MSTLKATYKGSCLCQAVTYEVDAIEAKMAHCHCSMCRKFHGAEYATFGEAKKEHFRWVSGQENLTAFVAQNGTTRQFCRHCGSSLTFAPANDTGEVMEFALATLDSEIPHRPDAHIFVASKANWSVIKDDLPQFSSDRDSPTI